MYKYICRNPPDDKYIFGNRLNSDDVFSVDEQKICSNSTPENSQLTKPDVIHSEKVQNDRRFWSPDQNEFNDSSSSNNKNRSENQTLKYSFIPHFPGDFHNNPLFPSQNSNWKICTNEVNPMQEPKNHKFDICSNKESKLTKDIFEVDLSLKLEDPKPVPPPTFELMKLKDPKPVPPPKTKVKQNLKDRAYLEKRKKIQLLKSSTHCKLNVPPLSKSDLQELLSSTSDNSVPLVNENLDKPVELNAKICTELEDQYKGSKPLPVVTIKPKQTSKVVERVIKEQDNLFGILLSTIDEQIMSKKDQKKNEKKGVKTNEDVNKDNKSDKNNKDIKIKHKKGETIVNENGIHKEKKNLKTNCDLKYRSKYSKHNTKYKEYEKDSKNKEHKSKSKDETKIKENDLKNEDFDSKSKDKEVNSKNKESVNKSKELKYKENGSKNIDYKKNEATQSEEYNSKMKEMFSKFKEPKNKDVKFTNNNPKYKAEKSATIKKVDRSRRSITKEEKQKTDKTIFLPTQSSNIDDKKYEQIPFQNKFNSQNDLFRPNRDQCIPNQIQFPHNKDETLIKPDEFCSNKDHFTPNQDHFLHKDHFMSNSDQFRRHSDEFRANFKFLNQDVPFRSKSVYRRSLSQELNPIEFYENEDKNKRHDFSFPKSSKDRGRHYSNKNLITSDKNRRTYPEDERRRSLDRFPNKDDYKDRRRSRLDDRFSREDKRFPMNKQNYLRRSRFDEKRSLQNENCGNHRKRTSTETKEEKPNIESKEEISSSLDTIVTKPIVVREYGIQNFQIPKIYKSEVDEKKKDEFDERKLIEDNKIEEIVKESKIEQEESKHDDTKENEVKTEPSTSKEVIDIPKTETEEKINMFKIFMKHIFGSCDSSFLLEYLEKFGKPIPKSKTKRVRRIINSDSESEEEIAKENEQVEKVKIEESPQTKATKQQTTDKLQEEENLIVSEEIKNTIRKQRIYSSDFSPEKLVVTNEESSVKENITIKKSVKKIKKEHSPLELLSADFKSISEGSFAETGDQNKEKDVYDILNDSKNKEKDVEQEETLEKEDKKEEINEISSENIFLRKRLRSSSRSFVEKNSTLKSSDEEIYMDEKVEEKNEEMVSVINELNLEKKQTPTKKT